MSSAPKIFIIILNWNGGKDTLECLRSVGKIDYPEFEIVVVDNGSTDGSPGAIHETFREVTLLETGQNLGYAEGNNVGIRHALAGGAEYILLLNNDTVVDAQLVSQLVEAAAKHPTAGIYQPKIYFCSDPKRIWFSATRWVPSEGVFTREQEGEIDQGENGQVRPTDYACGCSLFFHTEVARRVGLFDPRFFLCWEEIDWCYRARRHGYRCLFVPSAKVWHKVSSSLGGTESPMWMYFNFRNQLIWGKRHLPKDEWSRVFRRSILILRRSARRVLGRSLRGRPTDLRDLVFIQAGLDYLLRRYGDCPQWIRKHSTQDT